MTIIKYGLFSLYGLFPRMVQFTSPFDPATCVDQLTTQWSGRERIEVEPLGDGRYRFEISTHVRRGDGIVGTIRSGADPATSIIAAQSFFTWLSLPSLTILICACWTLFSAFWGTQTNVPYALAGEVAVISFVWIVSLSMRFGLDWKLWRTLAPKP